MDILRHFMAPVPCLFLDAAASDFAMFLTGCADLVRSNPLLVQRVESELDAHGIRKKLLRQKDERWRDAQQAPLAGIPTSSVCQPMEEVRLLDGRPRTPASVVLIFVMVRGYLGGFKHSETSMFLLESKTMAVFFANHGLSMPAWSTLTELTNAVSNDTRRGILDAQIRMIQCEAFDDFSTLIQDSTAVEGNSMWPTDSRLVVALLERVQRTGRFLPKFGLPILQSFEAEHVTSKLKELDRQIDLMSGGKNVAAKRLLRYRKVIRKGRVAFSMYTNELAKIRPTLVSKSILPSERERADRAIELLEEDLKRLERVLNNCEARVERNEKVNAKDKVVSLSDPDVAFIVKGQRETVLGYKPQLARSGGGYITGVMVPRGNVADSETLIPMYDQVYARTRVVPDRTIYDDGYASAANLAALKARKVRTISIGGSKGKNLTSRQDWNSDEHVEARNDRSAVESLMFTMKHGFDFGEVARRGLEPATADLLEKVLAYNLERLVRARAAQQWRQERDARLSA